MAEQIDGGFVISEGTAAASRALADLRCDCGSLMARLYPGGIEIKCRRCKAVHVIPKGRVENWGLIPYST